MEKFKTYNQYLRSVFGEKVQKISIDAGFTCPNRDGRLGYGGCTYCNNDKFNPGSDKSLESLKDQISRKILKYKKNNKNINKFIVYFQTYSNTYAPIAQLEEMYRDALSIDGVVGLSIGTRPDCVNDEVLDLLEKLKNDYYISVEYGLESVLDSTLLKINRGHDVETFVQAVVATQKRKIPVGAHLIFGFPWEDESVSFKSALFFNKLKVDFIKIHQLQVVKNTIMGNEYLKNKFTLLNKNEYLKYLTTFLLNLDPDIIVARFSGDCPSDLLLASGFNESSSEITKEITQYFIDNNLKQGMNRS